MTVKYHSIIYFSSCSGRWIHETCKLTRTLSADLFGSRLHHDGSKDKDNVVNKDVLVCTSQVSFGSSGAGNPKVQFSTSLLQLESLYIYGSDVDPSPPKAAQINL